MKQLYYMIYPCPVCGSRRTGRVVRRPLSGADYMMHESLKNGEIIRFAQKEPVANAFCLDCGHVWPQTAVAVWLTADEVESEKAARGTETMLEDFLAAHPKKKGFFGRISSVFR